MRLRFAPHSATALALAAAVLTASCSNGDDADSTAEPVAVDITADPTVTFGDLATDTGPGAQLSPDGSIVFYQGGGGICIAPADLATDPTTESATDERCATFDAGFDPRSIRFSADGGQLLLTEEFFRSRRDPDIWVLDIEAMTFVNRTDDGVARDGVDNGDLDLAATWMPDGSIVFVRVDGIDGDSRLMRLSGSGEPDEVSALSGVGPLDIAFPMVPIGDTELLALTTPNRGPVELLRIDLETGDLTAVATIDKMGTARISDVRDGMVLLQSEVVVGNRRDDLTSHVLIDLATGRQLDVFPADGFTDEAGRTIQPGVATFTPDGSAIVFTRLGSESKIGAITLEALLAGPVASDIADVMDLTDSDRFSDGALPWFSLDSPLRWTADGRLVGLVRLDDVDAVATLDFGAAP